MKLGEPVNLPSLRTQGVRMTKPKVWDCCPARASDFRELQNPPAGSNAHENVSTDAEGNTPSTGATVPGVGNTPLTQGGRRLKNLGGTHHPEKTVRY